jgi:DNA-binding response OmpR family regulator
MSYDQYEMTLVGRPGVIDRRGRVSLDRHDYRVYLDGRLVDLTYAQVRLTIALWDAAGVVVTYRKLYDVTTGRPGLIAGSDGMGHNQNIRTMVRRIRAAFKTIDADFDPIENRAAIGYAWDMRASLVKL